MDQNEINALMGEGSDPEDGDGANQADANAPGSSGDTGDTGDSGEDFGGLSQADIDAALGEQSAAPETPQESDATPASTPPASASAETEAVFSDDAGFSQADIDALMSGDSPAAASDHVAPEDTTPVAAAPEETEPMLDSEGKPMDEFARAMAEAMAEEKPAQPAASAADLPLEEVQLPSFEPGEISSEMSQPLSLLNDVDLHVRVELGRTRMFVEDVLRLGEGSVVELDRLAGDPVDVYVNGRLVARGEVLVLNDNFCVRINEIISDPEARLVG